MKQYERDHDAESKRREGEQMESEVVEDDEGEDDRLAMTETEEDLVSAAVKREERGEDALAAGTATAAVRALNAPAVSAPFAAPAQAPVADDETLFGPVAAEVKAAASLQGVDTNNYATSSVITEKEDVEMDLIDAAIQREDLANEIETGEWA